MPHFICLEVPYLTETSRHTFVEPSDPISCLCHFVTLWCDLHQGQKSTSNCQTNLASGPAQSLLSTFSWEPHTVVLLNFTHSSILLASTFSLFFFTVYIYHILCISHIRWIRGREETGKLKAHKRGWWGKRRKEAELQGSLLETGSLWPFSFLKASPRSLSGCVNLIAATQTYLVIHCSRVRVSGYGSVGGFWGTDVLRIIFFSGTGCLFPLSLFLVCVLILVENIFHHVSEKGMRGGKIFETSTCDKMFYCVLTVNCWLCKGLSSKLEFFPCDWGSTPTIIKGQQNSSRCLWGIFFFFDTGSFTELDESWIARNPLWFMCLWHCLHFQGWGTKRHYSWL